MRLYLSVNSLSDLLLRKGNDVPMPAFGIYLYVLRFGGLMGARFSWNVGATAGC